MGSIKADTKNALKAKLGAANQNADFGKFVVIPADQIAANRSKAYDYIF